MLVCIMLFVDRLEEMARLDRLQAAGEGGLAVVYGRRRIGKTRLLLDWSSRHGGLYTVADQSSAEIQRRYFAEAVAERLPGFAEAEYPDWRALLGRLARDAQTAHWRGPLVLDELPYLVMTSPELPSILQRWIDHEARKARIVVAVAGSSQRMMQGLVLAHNSPLYGRASEVLELGPIDPTYIREVFAAAEGVEAVAIYAAWGGVPRYWELASGIQGGVRSQVENLVLDPLGPLHREPDRLLLEEVPSALEVRPILDAIGAGAHRVSEIAGRLGRPATSMSRPLDRLTGMGLVRREVPFGESDKASRRSLYKIDDPFFRLWFRVVAPYRGQLASGTRRTRLKILDRFWDDLIAQAWEDLCRLRLPRLDESSPLGSRGPWGPASRWWRGTEPEWDVVSESFTGGRVLLGEAKWSARPFTKRAMERARAEILARPVPPLPERLARAKVLRVLFIPGLEGNSDPAEFAGKDLQVVTASEVLQPEG